ncbi:MAG: COX15/CtaA family protein, partial [Anaerolineae bacterium]
MNLTRFAKYAWGTLVYNVAVVVWGAYVRATGSGAGCGKHWPSCQGAVIPRAPRIETLVEFSHRLSSGLALLAVIGLLVWAFRAHAGRHPARRGAVFSMVFMITEAAVGAGLVLFELVAYNTSLARAIVGAVHLLNTFLLLASLALTAWWASGGRPVQWRGGGGIRRALAIALLGVLLLGMTGAITALGDTIFPSGSLAEGIAQDVSPASHFLVRLRVWHPVLAALVGLYTVVLAGFLSGGQAGSTARQLAQFLFIAVLAQLGAGVINLMLLAPVAMQLIHLLLADVVWIVLVLASAAILSK